MKVILSAEVWYTAAGTFSKSAARDTKGRILGRTNQTAAVNAAKVVRPRVTVVGRK